MRPVLDLEGPRRKDSCTVLHPVSMGRPVLGPGVDRASPDVDFKANLLFRVREIAELTIMDF